MEYLAVVFWGCITAGVTWCLVRRQKKHTDEYVAEMERKYQRGKEDIKETLPGFTITKIRTVYFPKAYTSDDRVFEGEVLMDTGETIYVNIRCEDADYAVEDTRFEDSDDLCDVAYAYTKDLKTLIEMSMGDLEKVLTDNTAQVDNLIDICNELYAVWRERPFIIEEWEAV